MTSVFRAFHLRRMLPAGIDTAVAQIAEVRDAILLCLRQATANPHFYLRRLQQITSDSFVGVNCAICLSAPYIFAFLLQHFSTADAISRIRHYSVIFNVADVTSVPDSVMEALSYAKNLKEAAQFVDICKQLELAAGLDFAVLYAQSAQGADRGSREFANFAEAVHRLMGVVYDKTDVTAAFMTFLPYIRHFELNFLITEAILNRESIIELAGAQFLATGTGLRLCFYYDIEPSVGILLQASESESAKNLKYFCLLVAKFNIAELEEKAIDILSGLMSDYRISQLEKASVLAAARSSYLESLCAFADSL